MRITSPDIGLSQNIDGIISILRNTQSKLWYSGNFSFACLLEKRIPIAHTGNNLATPPAVCIQLCLIFGETAFHKETKHVSKHCAWPKYLFYLFLLLRKLVHPFSLPFSPSPDPPITSHLCLLCFKFAVSFFVSYCCVHIWLRIDMYILTFV